MLCEQCNQELPDSATFCTRCGASVNQPHAQGNSASQSAATVTELEPTAPAATGSGIKDIKPQARSTIFQMSATFSVVMFTAAALTLVLSVIAAAFLHGSGVEIMQIRSVGGKTLEEAYYARLGGVYTGFAIMSVAFGVFAAALLSSFGYKTLKG